MIFSDEVGLVLHRAFVGAREAGHAVVTPEHVALELILMDEIATYLERCGTDLVAVESRLRACLAAVQPPAAGEFEVEPDSAFERVMQRSIQRTKSDHREHLMLRDLFLALLDERGSVTSAAFLEATREPQLFEELRSYRSDEERGAV